MLADALAANGHLADAIATLEEMVGDPLAVIPSNTPNLAATINAQMSKNYSRMQTRITRSACKSRRGGRSR